MTNSLCQLTIEFAFGHHYELVLDFAGWRAVECCSVRIYCWLVLRRLFLDLYVRVPSYFLCCVQIQSTFPVTIITVYHHNHNWIERKVLDELKFNVTPIFRLHFNCCQKILLFKIFLLGLTSISRIYHGL